MTHTSKMYFLVFFLAIFYGFYHEASHLDPFGRIFLGACTMHRGQANPRSFCFKVHQWSPEDVLGFFPLRRVMFYQCDLDKQNFKWFGSGPRFLFSRLMTIGGAIGGGKNVILFRDTSRSLQKVVKSKSLPKMAERFRLRIYNKLPTHRIHVWYIYLHLP